MVPDEGSLESRLVLVGEAPGFWETSQGRPFVGPSGALLQKWWRQVGLQRSDMYITNVVPYQPRGNKIETISQEELDEWGERLRDRLSQLCDPWLVVPTGNTALAALTGKTGITKWRGSILSYEGIKVIPTLHPAFILRSPGEARAALADWRRIAEDATFRELRLPEREYYIRPTLDDVRQFVEYARRDAAVLAIDIETPGGEIGCVGFSYDPSFSITIPTTLHYWQSPKVLDEVWQLIHQLCNLPCGKALQNGLFDTFHLALRGVRLLHYKWDTLAMHHCLDASDKHSLAYMASIDTRQPYWKDSRKDSEDLKGRVADFDTYWTYNGIDACLTRELVDIYHERLEKAGKLRFYEEHYTALLEPCLAMMLHGILVDQERRQQRLLELSEACHHIQAQLAELAGESLVGKMDLSTKKVRRFLYQTLKLPARKSRKTGGVTANEVALRSLRIAQDKKRNTVAVGAIDLILEHRRKFKLASFMREKLTDADDHIRCQIKFTTDTGRLASSKNPKGTGGNLFNVDREARDIYIPEPGHIWLELDASQLESRIVGALTGDDELIRLAKTPPWEFDQHRYNASIIFGVSLEAVTKEQRYLGKRAVHGTNYGMGAQKLSEVLLNDGYVRTPEECEAMMQAYLQRYQAVLEWQKRTRLEVMRTRRLVNSWGRELSFEYARLGDDVYRQAFAFRPQSDGSDLVKQKGVIPMHDFLLERPDLDGHLLISIYDSLIVSCPPESAWEIYQYGKVQMESPHDYYGTVMSIPAEVKLSRSWGDTKAVEFKQPPTKREFEAALKILIEREAA